jgi:tetratricopeptide (TPR) repeat protein
MGLLIAVLCLPLAFTIYLFAAAKLPALDRVTLALPMGVRAPVAEIAMRKTGHGKDSAKKIDRVLQLDPNNSAAWERRCTSARGNDVIPSCTKAIDVDPTSRNYYALGIAQREAKDFCAAEASFSAATKRINRDDADIMRNLGVAALRCGQLSDSQAVLQVVEKIDAKTAGKAAASTSVQSTDGVDYIVPTDPKSDDQDDDVYHAKTDLVLDREYLAVVYDRSKEPAKAVEACSKAHPEWKACHCELTDKAVACTGNPAVQTAMAKP